MRDYDNPEARVRRVAVRAAARLARREESRRRLTRLQPPGSPGAGSDLDRADGPGWTGPVTLVVEVLGDDWAVSLWIDGQGRIAAVSLLVPRSG